MSESNKTYRIRTKIGVNENSPVGDKYLTVNLTEKIDTIEVMSLKIKQENAYRFHSADYGVVVGRAIANGGFGVPNVKVSIFIAASQATQNDPIYSAIYPYTSTTKRNKDNIRYNLLPNTADDDCYQVVGTFPNKRLVLDDDNYLEIYDNYYKFTTRTNNAGDYMIFGIPTGGQILHFDTDLSDVGVLSQRPRDMIYKGYNINQFENANQFKVDDNLATLPQIISQDDSVYVYPFWGNENENIIGITRHDIDINYKFEPTCVFMGSIVSDSNSNHISKKCIPTDAMGLMEEMVTGSGTIEMIRKKQDGSVEEFNVQGTQLINENGVWCYQIPMNLDYMITDEYGNLVPSDDPTKGIATRTSVRFRLSMDDFENDSANSFRAKVLVPNNPKNSTYTPDYVFGSLTNDESFRDLLWNNVYTVKSFIPRFQKGNGNNNRRFSGIKQCNYHGQNNPIPYNNMRINLSFQFVMACLIIKLLIWVTSIFNFLVSFLAGAIYKLPNIVLSPGHKSWIIGKLSCIYIDGEMCEQLDGSWYFAPGCGNKVDMKGFPKSYLWLNMMGKVEGKQIGDDGIDYSESLEKNGGGYIDKKSIDSSNETGINDEESMVTIKYKDGGESGTGKTYNYVISRGINYFLQCIEVSLAKEYRVIQFDFYNDWINGMIYVPRWERSPKKKRKYFLFGKTTVEVRACNDNYEKRFFERKNKLTEQCAVSYRGRHTDNSVTSPVGCKSNKSYKCHKAKGRKQIDIFKNGGAVHSERTFSGLYAYYFKPCEYITGGSDSSKYRKINLFATDIVLLGSLTDCNINGTPVFTNELTSTTYQIPSPLAHTDSTEEGNKFFAESRAGDLYTNENTSGVFDLSESILNPTDDGSVTEESGIDWGYVGPGQGKDNKPRTYTPGGHFLGISCTNSESSIKSCVNLKRICEVGVWPSQRQEVFNGYDSGNTGTYLDIIPNGLISKDDISGGNFRKIFATMNKNGLRTKINSNGFTVYDFEYMSPENFGGDMNKYTKSNYNDPNPLSDESMSHYLAKNSSDVDEDGHEWENTGKTESEVLSLKPIRRSLDDVDSDYLRFRFGIDKLNSSELLKKYLGSDDFGYYMPVYDNSFYFYFGMVPGSTALEEFHKQFFAECKHTMSVEDLRFDVSLSYTGYGINDIFSKEHNGKVNISIFEKELTPSSGDSIKIYSPHAPIKIVVDGRTDKTIGTEYFDQTKGYYEYICTDTPKEATEYNNLFKFGVGNHTIRITDSNGTTVTKLIQVERETVTLCPKITPVDFTDENYIINPTANLINGNVASGNREYLGGWFNFEWGEESRCPTEGDCSGHTIFRYTDGCVTIEECLLLFVGMGKIIKVGGQIDEWSDRDILDFEIFKGYANPIAGRIVQSPTYHIYAGEQANYSLYILYRKGWWNAETQEPILLADGLEIGEPESIDFSIFREVVSSEDDSVLTFRNPLIKIWSKYPSDWYNHLYDTVGGKMELSYEQIWYIRKTLFYVLSGSTETDSFNEDFSSSRDLYINQFYPSNVGNVECFVKKATGGEERKSIIKVDGPGKWDIHITGETLDGKELRTPPFAYGSGLFRLPIFFKPFHYKAVVWEGYDVFHGGDTRHYPASYGEVNGYIYNGVVFDSSGNKQVFGYCTINENEITGITVTRSTNDFDNGSSGRISRIKYSSSTVFSSGQNTLTIREGHPVLYKGGYTPVEISLAAESVGLHSLWDVSLDIDLIALKTEIKVTADLTGDAGTTRYFFAKDKALLTEEQKVSMQTVDATEIGWYSFSIGGVFNINTSINGGEIKNGVIMAERMADNPYIYRGTQKYGTLYSRNFIRNEIRANFHVKSDFSFRTNVFYDEDYRKTLPDPDLPESYQRACIVRNITIMIPFEDGYFKVDFDRNVREVIIKFEDEDREYMLCEEFGYVFEYKNNGLFCNVTYSDIEPKDKTDDDFTSKILSYITNPITSIKKGWPLYEFPTSVYIEVISENMNRYVYPGDITKIDGSKILYNNTLNSVTIKNNVQSSCWVYGDDSKIN